MQAINYQFLALVAIVLVTVFSSWSAAPTTVPSWSVSHVQQRADIPWD